MMHSHDSSVEVQKRCIHESEPEELENRVREHQQLILKVFIFIRVLGCHFYLQELEHANRKRKRKNMSLLVHNKSQFRCSHTQSRIHTAEERSPYSSH